MFARNAKAMLILICAVLLSNGSLFLSPPLHPAHGHPIQTHEHRQSKRHTSFSNQVTDRWLYAKNDDYRSPAIKAKRRPIFGYLLSRTPRRKRTYRYSNNRFDSYQTYNYIIPINRPRQRIFRLPKKHRMYDVPQIECPRAGDGLDRFACPSPDFMGRYRCIDDHHLCDGFIDCPKAEDEDRRACMFYKTTRAHLDVVADAVLRWVRGR